MTTDELQKDRLQLNRVLDLMWKYEEKIATIRHSMAIEKDPLEYQWLNGVFCNLYDIVKELRCALELKGYDYV